MRVSVVYFIIALLATPATAKTWSSKSSEMTLVELYTSEGCSSCPPADEWISEQKKSGDIFKKFVPVVFHVDYWNYLGWTDSFSKETYSRRQRDYARLWKATSVFTPSVLINGSKWDAWRKGKPIPDAKRNPIGEIIVNGKGRKFKVTHKGKVSDVAKAHIALLGEGIVRKIGGGENSGKTLTHDYVVLDWQTKDLDTKTKSASFTMKPLKGYKPAAFAAWLEKPGQTAPLIVTGGKL